MHPLEKKVTRFLDRHQLALSGQQLLVGVSGGADSTALLYVLAALVQTRGLQGLTAVYVDHGLRPQEIAQEKEVLASHCRHLGLPLICCQVQIEENGDSLEAVARDRRYQALSQLGAEHKVHAIAVGHTADDQAEELLLRLLRGTGRSGLSGMRSQRYDLVIRPLLEISKDEILAYLGRYHISWCEDSSNQDLRFLRNQVRHQLLPELAKLVPTVRVNLQRTARILQDEEDLLARLASQAFTLLDCCGSAEIRLSIAPFLDLDLALQRRLVEEVFIRLQVRPSVDKIDQVLQLTNEGPGKGQLHFSQGLRLQKISKQLIFSFPAGRGAGRGNF